MGKLLLSALILILLASAVSASSYTIEINQVEDKTLVKHHIVFDNERTISIPLPQDAAAISSKLNYSLGISSLEITGKDIELSYLTSSNLEQLDEGYFFVETIKFNFPVDEATINLILQEGNYLEAGKIFPQPNSIETDGQQITVSWNLNNITADSDIPIFASIKTPVSSSNLIFWIFIALAVVVIVYLTYLNYQKRKIKSPQKKHKAKPKEKQAEKQAEDYEKYLLDSEKAVLQALKEAGGELWQKQIQLKTNFSKAKLSRVIRNLESRNLIEKISFGNTNKVRLK